MIIIYIIIIIIFLICFVKNIYKCEFFKNNIFKIDTESILGVAKHVKLNKFNRIENISVKPPIPNTGETECVETECPNYITSNSICWRCQ